MNVKGVAVVAAVIAIILVVVLLPLNSSGPPAPISDIAEVRDTAEVGIEPKPETPTISDSVQVEDGKNYYIDENGLKHYIVSVEDSPNLDG